MKRMLYLAVGLLAAAACTRQPVVPEEPLADPEEEQLFDVTLIAGSPETRTEVWADPETGKFLPYWSAGEETIGLVRLPEEEDVLDQYSDDAYGFPDYFSFSGYENTRSDFLTFTGRASRGTYLAYYPDWHDEVLDGEGNRVQEPYGCDAWLDSEMTGHFLWTVPFVQHPPKDSFDPTADSMISESPFGIHGETATSIVVGFTRLNAIVRVVLQDKQTPGDDMAFPLAGQHVRLVTLGIYTDDEEDGPLLSGDIEYRFFREGGDSGPEYEGDDYVVAEYTDETTYVIGEAGAATFFITLPCVLKQSENPLHILVETDDYIIERSITLPTDVALQPSRMTTLNVGLFDDGVNGTKYTRKGLTVMVFGDYNDDTYMYDLIPVSSLEVAFHESVEVLIGINGIDLPDDDPGNLVFGPEESAFVSLIGSPYFDNDYWAVRGPDLYGLNLGNDTFTVSLPVGDKVYTASIPVTVCPGQFDRSLDGNYGDDNMPGGGVNEGNTVILGGEL